MNQTKKILLVEDNQLQLFQYGKFLLAEGYELQTALSGAEAIEILESKSFAAVICDVQMRPGSGLIVLRYLNSFPEGVPLLLHSNEDTYREGGLRLIPHEHAFAYFHNKHKEKFEVYFRAFLATLE